MQQADHIKPTIYSTTWFVEQRKQHPFNPDKHYIAFYSTRSCYSCGYNVASQPHWYVKTACPKCHYSFVD